MTVVVPRRDGPVGSLAEPVPFWLTDGEWPLFCLVHEPVGPAHGVVVLCSPLFGEEVAGRPLYRLVGRALAERGLLALRFDYEGTGDSGGPSTAPGRLAAWLCGVDAAVAAARGLSRGPVALLGVRSGALLAAAATERGTDVDAIALWDPWRSGRQFLRRERALHALRFQSPPDAGHLEVPGLVLDDEIAAALTSLRLPQRLPARRALVVVPPGTSRAAVALETRRGGSALYTTADVLEAAPGEQESLFEGHPLRRRMPVATVSNVVQWLADAVTELRSSPRVGAAAGSPGDADPGAGARRAHAARPVPGSGLLAIRPAAPGELTVYERSVRLGRHGFFGVESVRFPSLSSDAPIVLFFPSGADSHVGPHRLWVVLARRWAALGARCIRVDLSGLGESPPREGCPERVIRAPEAFDDVTDIVYAVGGPRRVVLVGLCSAAYQALESAIELEPFGVLAVNPLLRFTPPEVEAGGEVFGRRRLCQARRNWESAARRVLSGRGGQALADVRRVLRRRLRSWTRATTTKARIALAGVDVRILCSPYEAEQLAVSGLVDRPAEGLRVEVVPDLEHALGIAAQRQMVAERLTTMLREMAGSRLHGVPHTQAPTEASAVTPNGALAERERGGHDDLRRVDLVRGYRA